MIGHVRRHVSQTRKADLGPNCPNEFGRNERKMSYLSERESGKPVQGGVEITPGAWHGITGLINSYLRTGRFAESFPDRSCTDPGMSEAITGSNERHFFSLLIGEHPGVEIPLNAEKIPGTVEALEVLEFCYRHVSEPVSPDFHDHFAHSHYRHFSKPQGRQQFAQAVNTILARNHLAFHLKPDGEIERLLPPVLGKTLQSSELTSEDGELNRLLISARTKFSSPNFRTRYDATPGFVGCFRKVEDAGAAAKR